MEFWLYGGFVELVPPLAHRPVKRPDANSCRFSQRSKFRVVMTQSTARNLVGLSRAD
jgi:hypothetical protein